MNIQPQQQNNNPQFKAIRRIKCNAEEFLKIRETYKEVFTTQEGTRTWFKNESIHHADVIQEIYKIASEMGNSSTWLKANCKQHGINLPDLDKAPLYEFTDGSVLKLLLYRLKTVWAAIKFGLTNSPKAADEVPPHLITIKAMNDFANKMKPRFEKFLEKNNVEDISLEDYVKILQNNGAK